MLNIVSEINKELLVLRRNLGGLFFFLFVFVEVLEVLVGRQLGYPWRLNALLLDNGPVDAGKPRVFLNVISSTAQAAQSLGHVLLQQSGDEGPCHHGHVRRELVVANRDGLVDLIRIRVVERRVPEGCVREDILTLTASRKGECPVPTSRHLGCVPGP